MIQEFSPPAARGAFLKNRPPGPPKKLLLSRFAASRFLLFRKPKGKILRVKQGYNPNSSSMGSIIFVLPAAMLAVTAVFGALSGLLAPLLLRKIDRQEKTNRLYLKLQKLFFNKKIKDAQS